MVNTSICRPWVTACELIPYPLPRGSEKGFVLFKTSVFKNKTQNLSYVPVLLKIYEYSQMTPALASKSSHLTHLLLTEGLGCLFSNNAPTPTLPPPPPRPQV